MALPLIDETRILGLLQCISSASVSELQSPSRKRELALARGAIAKYLHEVYGWTYERISADLHRSRSGIFVLARTFSDLLDIKDSEAVWIWQQLTQEDGTI